MASGDFESKQVWFEIAFYKSCDIINLNTDFSLVLFFLEEDEVF